MAEKEKFFEKPDNRKLDKERKSPFRDVLSRLKKKGKYLEDAIISQGKLDKRNESIVRGTEVEGTLFSPRKEKFENISDINESTEDFGSELNFTFRPRGRFLSGDLDDIDEFGQLRARPEEAVLEPVEVSPVVREKPTIEEATIEVQKNQSIADISRVRADALVKVSFETNMTPDEIVVRNRNRNLDNPTFSEFFGKVFASGKVMERVVTNDRFNEANTISVADREIPTPTDIIPEVFREVFNNDELLNDWMRAVDTRVRNSSESNLEAIDNAAGDGEVIKKDVVLVGGGPLTSIAASILGPFCNVTVITDQRSIGKPWRNRPMYINSSTDVKDRNGARLPLLDGTTTPVSLSQQLNNLDTDVLLGKDTLDVACEDGSVRKYASGIRLGKLIATEIAFNAGDYIVEQTVDPKNVGINADGTKRLKLTDPEGNNRDIDANTVIFLTGPGREKSTLDAASTFYYDIAGYKVRESIRQARMVLSRGGEAPELDLPAILTLTSIEKLHEFWVDDLNSDPDKYPFKKLFNQDTTIANIGGGDTTRVLKEFVDGKGPKEAYPEDFDASQNIPQTTLVNEQAFTPEEYRARNRRRYGRVFDDRTNVRSSKVAAVRTRFTDRGETTQLTYSDSNTLFSVFDFAFVSTGLQRDNLRDTLSVPVSTYYDNELQPVGIGNSENGVYGFGTAAGFNLKDFPPELRNIIDGLNITKGQKKPENIVSLWANGLTAERGIWSILAQKGPSRDKLEALASSR